MHQWPTLILLRQGYVGFDDILRNVLNCISCAMSWAWNKSIAALRLREQGKRAFWHATSVRNCTNDDGFYLTSAVCHAVLFRRMMRLSPWQPTSRP